MINETVAVDCTEEFWNVFMKNQYPSLLLLFHRNIHRKLFLASTLTWADSSVAVMSQLIHRATGQ